MKILLKFSWVAILAAFFLFACNQNTRPQGPQSPGPDIETPGGGEVPGEGETPGGGETPGEGETPGVEEEPDGGETTQYVRQNASTSAAADDLTALASAMQQMRDLPCTDTRSWYYQGAIHWVPDDFPDNENPLCPEYTGNGTLLMDSWDNCTHNNVSGFHFLVWHRLYIYYFENIVRELSGKADFALPYWDYATVPPTPPNRVMPSSFSNGSSSLFESARLPLLNNGDPIQSFMDGPLSLSSLFDEDTYQSFNSSIDAAPHGAMHVYIGGGYERPPLNTFNQIYQTNMTGLMYNVPSAAFDPIFWVHHAEIDYIWAQWMRTDNGRLPSLADMEANQPITYAFFNGDGSPVNLTIAEARELAFNLPVTYAPFVDNDAIASRTTQTDGLTETTSVARQSMSNRVSGARTDFDASVSVSRDVFLTPPEPDTRTTTLLELTVSFNGEEDPKGIYEVYMKHSHVDKDVQSEDQLIGYMTFFGAAFHSRLTRAPGTKATKTFTFDLKDHVDFTDFRGKFDISIKNLVDDGDDVTIENFHLKKKTIRES